MPTDNVIPISGRRRHPEAIPAPDAGQRRFRWFVAGLAVVWAGALAAAVAFTPLPSIWPLLALAVLVVAAEHRFILFGDETSMSSSIVVILCAVAYWRNDAFLVGPMLVAACGGLLVQHFRSRSLLKIAANAFGMSVAAAGGSLVFFGFSFIAPSSTLLGVALIATGWAYWVINNAVVACYVACTDSQSFPRCWWNLTGSDTETVWYGIGASVIALFAEPGSWMPIVSAGLLAIASIVSPGRDASQGCNHSERNDVVQVVQSTCLIAAVLLGVTSASPSSWMSYSALAIAVLGFGSKGRLAQTVVLDRLAFVGIGAVLCISSTWLTIAVACIAVVISRSRRVDKGCRQSAASAALISTVASMAWVVSTPVGLLAPGVAWCAAVALAVAVGSRLLVLGRSAHRLTALSTIGIAVPGRDDLEFAIWATITCLAIQRWPFVGIPLCTAALLAMSCRLAEHRAVNPTSTSSF